MPTYATKQKCVVVTSSSLSRYNRWDPRFFLCENDTQETVDNAKQEIKIQAKRILNAKDRATKIRQRMYLLLARDEVKYA
jgi:hypothetical protein